VSVKAIVLRAYMPGTLLSARLTFWRIFWIAHSGTSLPNSG
jgi:hypothetical protein